MGKKRKGKERDPILEFIKEFARHAFYVELLLFLIYAVLGVLAYLVHRGLEAAVGKEHPLTTAFMWIEYLGIGIGFVVGVALLLMTGFILLRKIWELR